jgi:hypothetical protein
MLAPYADARLIFRQEGDKHGKRQSVENPLLD